MNKEKCWKDPGSKNGRGEIFKFGTIVMFVGNESLTLKSRFLKNHKLTVKKLIGSFGIMSNPCTHKVSESLIVYGVHFKQKQQSAFMWNALSVKNLDDLKPIGRISKRSYFKYF